MKRKILSAVVYATTAFALWQFLDSLYAGEPVRDHLVLIYSGIVGTILSAAACVLSLFTKRVGLVCGLVGAVLAWPGFSLTIPKVPFLSTVSIFPDSTSADLLTAILALVVSSFYGINQFRLLFRRGGDIQDHHMGMKLAVAFCYAAGVFLLTNWHGIGDWLFRLRYSN